MSLGTTLRFLMRGRDEAEVCSARVDMVIHDDRDTDTFYPGSYGEVPAQDTSGDSAEDARKESGYGGSQDMDTEIGG